jgi:hypothetical protein
MLSMAWRRAGAAVRTLLGALSLVGGFTWVLLNLHGTHPALDSAVGLVLVAGGLVLLMPHRVRLPRRTTAAATTVAALAGSAAGLAASSAQVCCAFAYAAARGWPFAFVRRGGIADDPGTARRIAESANWHVDRVALTADLVLWAYAGMRVVVVGVLVRRAVADRGGRRARLRAQ